MLRPVAAAAALLMGVQAAEVNPIRKVVTLLQEMQKEIDAEAEVDEELMEKFNCYCKNGAKSLAEQAEKANAANEEFQAKMEAETSEKKQVDGDLAQAKADRKQAKEDLAKATEIRKKEHEEYLAVAGETAANIEATGKALTALNKGMGRAFIQTGAATELNKVLNGFSSNMDEEDATALNAFLQAGTGNTDQIIGILTNMKEVMEKSLGETEANEKSAAESFKGLEAAKNKEIAATTASIESLTARSGQLAVSIVENKAAAGDAADEAADAAEFLANLDKTCKEKQAEYEKTKALRADEIAAIGQAIGILNNDDALELFNKTLKKPEEAAPKSFLQKSTRKADNVSKARVILSGVAFNKNSPVSLLSATLKNKLRSKTLSAADFSKIVKMIDDMVKLLGEEQKSDAKHKKWCEGEFEANDDETVATKEKIASLASAIGEMGDEIESLTGEIADSNAKIAETDKAVAEATEQRKAEHAEFNSVVQANNLAIKLLGKAENKLQSFYNPELAKPEEEEAPAEGEEAAPAFVQIRSHMQQPGPAPAGPAAFESKEGKSNGVVALLQKMVKELETDIADAEYAEKTSQKDYEELMADSSKLVAEEKKAIADKSKAKADLENNLEEAKRNHKLADTALFELQTYKRELHESCDFIMESFEARKEGRTNEIEGLKRAKAVLAGADYSFFF